MALTYRTAGDWGAGKGSNLTAAEADGNIFDLDQRLEDVEENPAQPDEISNITVAGDQMTVWLESGGSFGPFTLPRAEWRWRDTWQSATDYFVNDLVVVTGQGVFLVVQLHTSAGTFDPDAGDTDGNFYQQVFGPPEIESLDDADDVEYGTAGPSNGDQLIWQSGAWVPQAPAAELESLGEIDDVEYPTDGPSDGDVLVFANGAWAPVQRLPVFTVSADTLTPGVEHANGYIRFTNEGGCAVTVPTNAAVAYAIGTELHFRQSAAGAVTIDGDGGVTVNGVFGFDAETGGPGAVVTVKKVATDTWDLFGLLAEEGTA